MRTWVRRVRLWLGVLLLAVGVVGCTVGMFVDANATWWWMPSEVAGERAELPNARYTRFSTRYLEVGAERGLLLVAASLTAEDSRMKLPPVVVHSKSVRQFRWNCSMRPLSTHDVLSTYSELRASGWDDWRAAGFLWQRRDESTGTAANPGPANSIRKSVVVQVPFYLPLLLGVALCFSPLRAVIVKRRRGKRGECLACGYDRPSLAADQPCPECGGVQRAKAANGQRAK